MCQGILFAIMEVDIFMSLRGPLPTLCGRSYEICNLALYLAVGEEAQSLRRHDSTVEEFHH